MDAAETDPENGQVGQGPPPGTGRPVVMTGTCAGTTPTAVVRVCGCLDASARARLSGACAEAARTGHRLSVDLRSVTSFTDAGVAAIADCWRAARGMAGGVHVEVSTPQGRAAMLMSMERAAATARDPGAPDAEPPTVGDGPAVHARPTGSA